MTIRSKAELEAEAQKVIDLDGNGGGAVTPLSLGTYLKDLSSSAALVGATTAEWHVDDIEGDDSRAGTSQATALKTFAALALRIATLQLPGTATDIYIYPHSTTTGYSGHELMAVKPHIMGGRCRMIGVGREAHPTAPVMTLASYSTANLTLTMSADPGVADGLYAGWGLDVVTPVGSNPALTIPAGTSRDIVWHEGTTFQLRASRHYVGTNVASFVEAGTTFRVARPAVAINCAEIETDPNFPTTGKKRLQIIGGPATTHTHVSPNRHYEGELQLVNLHFRHPDGDVSPVHVSGFVRPIQCQISCDTAGTGERFWTLVDAHIVSGHYAGYGTYGPGEYSGYNGLSSVSRSPTTNPVKFGVWAHCSTLDGGYVLGQSAMLEGTSFFPTEWSLFDAVGRSSSYPHGALLLQNAHMHTGTGSTPRLLLRTPGTSGYSIEVNARGYLECYRPFRQLSTSTTCIRVRHGGEAEFGNGSGPTGDTSLFTTGMQLEYRARVRVIGSGGSAFKQAIVGGTGASSTTTRNLVATPLVVGGPEVTSSDGSILMRTG